MKTLTVSDEVHQGLVDLGKKGETFDDIILKLLKGVKK
jgi:predicted CopG family antitoxin